MISIRKVKNLEQYKRDILYVDNRCYSRDRRFNSKALNYFLTQDSILYIVEKYNMSLDKSHTIGYMLCYPDSNYFYLCSLAVLKKYRKDGIGRMLFNKFLKEGKNKCLRLHAVNPIMIHMAEGVGFKIIRRNRNYFGNTNAVLMELEVLKNARKR
jgi:ribosomal protein S18 acetylase RimI-like enzyme